MARIVERWNRILTAFQVLSSIDADSGIELELQLFLGAMTLFNLSTNRGTKLRTPAVIDANVGMETWIFFPDNIAVPRNVTTSSGFS